MNAHQIDFNPGSLARKVLWNLCFTYSNYVFYILVYNHLFINALERSYKDKSGNIIKVVYPPHSSFILPNNTGITFTAFQKFAEEDVAAVSINEINNLISQNKFLHIDMVQIAFKPLTLKGLPETFLAALRDARI
ncbi:hypothetical protein H5410_050041 [Solanum commersonii]|uniref:Uncharacterized protein n=1 Tax=Solanum commersonii TaxID=4109 RepID=A0A9J5WWU1_SOLCO|nr:hypothetical protein H5410_050041 [Solanum commersonii]